MPSYCVARGIYNIHRNCMSNIICDNDVTQSKCQNRNVTFAMSGCCLGNYFIFFLVISCLFFLARLNIY